MVRHPRSTAQDQCGVERAREEIIGIIGMCYNLMIYIPLTLLSLLSSPLCPYESFGAKRGPPLLALNQALCVGNGAQAGSQSSLAHFIAFSSAKWLVACFGIIRFLGVESPESFLTSYEGTTKVRNTIARFMDH
jgi:hypothetical protein